MTKSDTKKIPKAEDPENFEKRCIEAAYHFYAADEEGLKIRLEEIEVTRQMRLKKEKKRVLKAQRKAEREADPVKMEKHLEGLRTLRNWIEHKKAWDEQ
jgi:hypothetical protein